MPEDILDLALDLRRRREAFALATVVRCEAPTSAKPGAKALIHEDGRVEGWVGGACAEPVVVREALHALRDGRPRLIGLYGEGGREPTRAAGILDYAMTCHSGGTLEIYVEPYLPKSLLVLVGHGPVVEALAALGQAADHTVVVLGAEALARELERLELTAWASVVVATHGEADEDALALVLGTNAGYVSLVASRRRAGVILERLKERDVPLEHLDRMKAPAGLDIGAVTPEEVAVSILAEIIHHHRSRKPSPPPAVVEAIDPVCGMSVDVARAEYRSEVTGQAVYFCCRHCQETFEADPTRYRTAPGG